MANKYHTDASVELQGAISVDVSTLATSAQIGEVQVSPTANTLLDRVKTGNVSLSSIDGKITACNTGAIAGTVTANPPTFTSIIDGSNDVAAHATPEALGSSTAFKTLYVRAKSTNTGNIYIGNASSQTLYLAADEMIAYTNGNIANIYIKSDVDGEGVVYGGEA